MTEFKYTGQVTSRLSSNSRYKDHRIIELDGDTSQETWNPPVIPDPSEGDRVHRVDPNVKWRLDWLAIRYYGDESLWWVIAFANDIIDPFQELNVSDAPVFLRIVDPKLVTRMIQ